MEVKVVSLSEVVDGITQMLHVLAGKGVEIVAHLDAGLDLVRVDPDQMSQVVMNLTVNARDAMPHGGRLSITTMNYWHDADSEVFPDIEISPGPYARLRVSDNGSGIEPEIRSRVFEPFFTTKESGKGTGLGLSMIYGIVNQSGGTIHLDSEMGTGTTFNILLPSIDPETGVEISGELFDEVDLSGTETVLVIEDEESVRDVACTILQAHGYTVLSADGCDLGLALADENRGTIDLLLTDVIMPKMEGPELAYRLAAEIPDLKVLYMSGYHDKSVFEGYEGNGDPAVIQKPFSPTQLSFRVRQLLDA